jgi:hypothetical protein
MSVTKLIIELSADIPDEEKKQLYSLLRCQNFDFDLQGTHPLENVMEGAECFFFDVRRQNIKMYLLEQLIDYKLKHPETRVIYLSEHGKPLESDDMEDIKALFKADYVRKDLIPYTCKNAVVNKAVLISRMLSDHIPSGKCSFIRVFKAIGRCFLKH